MLRTTPAISQFSRRTGKPRTSKKLKVEGTGPRRVWKEVRVAAKAMMRAVTRTSLAMTTAVERVVMEAGVRQKAATKQTGTEMAARSTLARTVAVTAKAAIMKEARKRAAEKMEKWRRKSREAKTTERRPRRPMPSNPAITRGKEACWPAYRGTSAKALNSHPARCLELPQLPVLLHTS